MGIISDEKVVLNGLVLVGGKSSRMGSAKAHLVKNGRPLWQISRDGIAPMCQKVFFSTSPQLEPPLPVAQELLISDVFANPIGPLGGIMSAFHRERCAWLVLACDLPYFDEEAARFLCAQRHRDKKATAFISNDVEPLAAIYEPEIFVDLASAWARGERCPRKIVRALDVERVIPENPQWIVNVNHAHEWRETAKVVTVFYYASLRECSACAYERVEITTQSVGDVYRVLREKYQFPLGEDAVRFAVNDRLVERDLVLSDGDELVFIPPVSGG